VKADSPAAGEGKRKPYKQNTNRVPARAMEKAFACINCQMVLCKKAIWK